MIEQDKYILEKDKNFRFGERKDQNGNDMLTVLNPLGYHRLVTSLKYLRVGETKVGVIAIYRDEKRSDCSYISMWDGRGGRYEQGSVTDGSFYVPWMDCFALCLAAGNKAKKKTSYLYIPLDKKNSWLTGAIMVFNNDGNTGATIQFNEEYGPYIQVLNSEVQLPIDEIHIASGTLGVCSGDNTFNVMISRSDKELYGLPNRAKVRYQQDKILENE